MLKIITGCAGSGKTSYCLRSYRQMLAQIPFLVRPGETLWISPTHLSAAAALQNLFAEELQACFSPGVMTFDQFAEKVIRGTGTAAQMISASQKKMLLKSVVSQAAEQQELRHFFKIHQTRGFLSQLNRLIAELKRDEIWPEIFRDRLKSSGMNNCDHDLCLLYERYQQKLLDWNRYDNEGRYWLARTLLQRNQWQAFPRLQQIVVDGFTDFTPTQLEMLIDLAAHADQLLLTLPLETTDRRLELFSVTRNSCQQLIQRAASKKVAVEQIPLGINSTVFHMQGGMIKIRQDLFEHPHQLQPSADQSGCHLIAALGMKAEVREIITRVKRLLIAGVAAADIGITVRDLSSYKQSLHVIGKDAGVRLWIMQPESVFSLSLSRCLLRWYEVIKNDWSYVSLKKLLIHTPLRFQQTNKSALAKRTVLQLLKQWNLPGERQEIIQQFGHAAKKMVPAETDDTLSTAINDLPTRVAVQEAAAVVQELDRLLKSLQKSASYVDQTRQLLAIGREYFVADTSRTGQSRSAEAVHKSAPVESEWDLIARLLNEAARFQDELTQIRPAPPVSWQEYASWLEEVFRNQLLQLEPKQPDEIAVLPAEQARHLNFRHLFVLGLQEGSFPAGQEATAIYSDRERERWSGTDKELSSREYQYREELQFFYRLLTQTQQQLTISYSRVSTRGEPQYACSFYQEVKNLFHPTGERELLTGDLSPLPQADALLTKSDCRLAAVQQMQNKQPELLAWWGSLSQQNNAYFQLQAVVAMNTLRFETQGWTSCEGVLRSPVNIRRLQQKFHDQYTFSASRLESYANCPFRYFLEQILGVDWQDRPELKTDYRRRGNIVHDVLAELHGLQMDHSADLQLTAGVTLVDQYISLLKARFQQQFRGTKLQSALDSIEQELLSEWAEYYSSQQENYEQTIAADWQTRPSAQYREIAFGKPATDDPAERNEPCEQEVYFGGPNNKIKVEGRIDRLDVGVKDDQVVFNVIDYKTSSPKNASTKSISRGTQLQLALYAVAVVRLNLLGKEAIPWSIGYWSVREKGYLPQFVNTRKKNYAAITAEEFINLGAELDRVIPELVQLMRAGFYPVHNDDASCTGACPHKTICRVNQVRSVAERLHKTWNFAEPLVENDHDSTPSTAE